MICCRSHSGTDHGAFAACRQVPFILPVLVIAVLSVVSPPVRATPESTPTPPTVPASGPGFKTLAAFTLPPTFYVGDRVELRIRLRAADATVLRAPAKMPTDQWFLFDSITISQAKDYSVVHIFFVSFAPGLRSFPPVDLGGVVLNGIQVTTTSLLSGGRTRLTDPKGQLLLPGTTLILALVVALLIGLPLGGFLLYRRLRFSFLTIIENRRARRPWLHLSRALDALASGKPPVNPRRFYITLTDELRRYLTLKMGSDFHTVTAREFVDAARKSAVEEEAATGLSAIMSFGELVKFAGAEAGVDTLQRDLSRVRGIVEGIEERSERELRAQREQMRASNKKVSR